MKPNLNTFILIAGFIAVILYFDRCRQGEAGSVTGSKDTVYVVDSTKNTIIHVPVFYPAPSKPEIPANLDTFTVISEHFTPQPFEIHYRDSSVEINHVGTLFENRIKTSDLSYKNLRPTQLITHVRPDPKGKLSLGLFAGYSSEPFIGGMAMYSDRRDRSILVGYGTGKTVLIGMGWKISFRKR